MTVKEFFELTKEDDILELKAIKEAIKGRNFIKSYKCRSFVDFPYWKLLDAMEYYKEGNLVYLCSLTLKIGHIELLNTDYKDFVYFLKYIEEEFEKIQTLESTLSIDNDPEESAKMAMCGIEKMNRYEELNIIDELSDHPWNWDKVRNMRYKDVYVKLLRNKDKADIQRERQKLNNKK